LRLLGIWTDPISPYLTQGEEVALKRKITQHVADDEREQKRPRSGGGSYGVGRNFEHFLATLGFLGEAIEA